MATQVGMFPIIGTIGNLTFYEMDGKFYVRRKTEVSKKRIKNDPQYKNTMRNANWFGQAVKLAKQVYHELPREERDQKKVWYPLRNRAQELVRMHLSAEEVLGQLRAEYLVIRKTKNNIIIEKMAIEKQQTPAIQISKPNTDAFSIIEKFEFDRSMNELTVFNPDKELVLTLIDRLAVARMFIKNMMAERKSLRERMGGKKALFVWKGSG